MSQQIINISTPDDGLGDVLRNGFDKTNQNFTELYNAKVDKISGKGLSENDFTDTLKTKLDGIEEGAQVNVRQDFGENDPDSPLYIPNRPPSLYASVGYFLHNDLATQTTPISVLSGVETQLTNDTDGAQTSLTQAPYLVSNVWDSDNNKFDFSQLSVGDTLEIRADILLTTTAVNQKYKLFLRVGDGSVAEYDLLISQGLVKSVVTDEQIVGQVGFSINYQEHIDNATLIYIVSDANCDVKVNGWYTRVIRKNLNIVEIAGGGGSWGSITGTLSDQTDLQSALNAKQETLVSGTNIKTVNGVSILGSGDLITLEDKDVFGTTQNEWIGSPSGWVSTNQPTTTGTADNVAPSLAGNEFLKTWRRRYVSASTAGSSVEFRDASFRNIAIGSGFTAIFKFGFEDASAVANARSFVGFYGSNATFGNVNPSAQTNLVGVSNDTGEANLQLIHRGSGGTAVKVDLGANFPSNTIATDEYMLILVNEFGSTEVTYYVYRLNTSDVATGTITTDLPASTVGLSPYFWRNNGTTALAVRLSLMKYGLYKRF